MVRWCSAEKQTLRAPDRDRKNRVRLALPASRLLAFSSLSGLLGVSKRGPYPPGLGPSPRHTGQSSGSAGRASYTRARDTFLGLLPAPAHPRREVQWELRTPPGLVGELEAVAIGTRLSWQWPTNVSPEEAQLGRRAPTNVHLAGTQLSRLTPTNVSPDETRPSRAAPALDLVAKADAGAVGPARPDMAGEDCGPREAR